VVVHAGFLGGIGRREKWEDGAIRATVYLLRNATEIRKSVKVIAENSMGFQK
jgi:hypothetical protein